MLKVIIWMPLQNLSINYITDFFSQWLCATAVILHSISSSHFVHTPKTKHFNSEHLTSLLLLISHVFVHNFTVCTASPSEPPLQTQTYTP